jgi:hypothetical protein
VHEDLRPGLFLSQLASMSSFTASSRVGSYSCVSSTAAETFLRFFSATGT